MAEPTERDIQEALYEQLICIVPEDSAHGDHWHRADCDCGWATTGSDGVVEDAAYEHITEVHMLGLTKVGELIVAATRRQVAEEIEAECRKWADGSSWGDGMVTAEAIARGTYDRGEADTKEQK